MIGVNLQLIIKILTKIVPEKEKNSAPAKYYDR